MLHLLLLAFLIPDPPELPEENKAAIAYLHTLQTPSGGYIAAKPAPGQPDPLPSLRTTRTGLRAYRLLGGEPKDGEAIIRFLKGCHDEKVGGFADRPGLAAGPISTAVGLMVLAELKLPFEPYLPGSLKVMAEKTNGFEDIRMVAAGLEVVKQRLPENAGWLKEIAAARNPDGSYGSGPGQARSTALYAVAKARLGGPPDPREVILMTLQTGQRGDGGFGNDKAGGSDLESCYRVVRMLARLGAQPHHPEKLRAFIAKCRNDDGGFGVRPGAPSSLHGTYYAAIVRQWLDGGKEGVP